MGYLLKEALKTVCGVNQWSYAVFWKIGCQNPKLLIWEECYYEPITYSNSQHIPGIEGTPLASRVPAETHSARSRVHLLVTKMMTDNYINLLGEGLVGRAAFTGNPQWISSDSFSREAHPPEVSNEVCLQFSAGIQTISVIPVLPHGVIQLGSSLNVMENMGFVNDVRTLVIQLGYVPGALLSENYARNEHTPKTALHTDPISAVPIYLGKPVSDPSGRYKKADCTPFIFDSCSQQVYSSQASGHVGQASYSLLSHVQDNPHTTGSTFQSPTIAQISGGSNNNHYQVEFTPTMKQNLPFGSQLRNGVTGAAVIPSNADFWLNEGGNLHGNSKYDNQPAFGSLTANYGSSRSMEPEIFSNAISRDHVNDSLSTSNSLMLSQKTNEIRNGLGGRLKLNLSPNSLSDAPKPTTVSTSCVNIVESGPMAGSSKTEASSSNFADHLPAHYLYSGSSDCRHQSTDEKCMQNDLNSSNERLENCVFQTLNMSSAPASEQMSASEHMRGFIDESKKHDYGYLPPRLNNARDEEACVKPPSGDDLFDILGVDFKNKLFDGSWNNILTETSLQNLDRNSCGVLDLDLQGASSDLFSVNEGEAESGIFSTTTDHLLDAVISKVHSSSKQSSDDNVSCRTTLTKTSSSSAHIASSSSGRANGFSLMQGELLGIPKSVAKAGALRSCSSMSGFRKEDGGSYSDTNSIYASQISSWVEQGHEVKQNSSASTAYSKKPNESSKSNRKRLKPGDNPRPRPKDRQMIQDRVKELREIIPNGAKCSIDALLERTIKHMLFLQSVSKHADKLKLTGESKIISKDGGLLLKDNFEGGATWAYEVGSQSMVCPIIVEDLNTPRQMLVEMLCEERGLFLEIADIIRGLGLTILKGVMEARNEKIWARFTVEANRDVTRMEIFISLVRLLEQTVKSSASTSDNCLDNGNVAVHQPFHQASSIPATGRPCSLP